MRGHVSTGRVIVVHRLDCRHARARPQDWVPLTWSESVQGDFISDIRLKLFRKRGMLAKITAEIASAESSIENVQMPDRAGSEAIERSEKRRVGKECVSTGGSRWWPYH